MSSVHLAVIIALIMTECEDERKLKRHGSRCEHHKLHDADRGEEYTLPIDVEEQ